jgi:hypothetical protein
MLYAVLMPFRIECVEESLKRMPEVLMAQRDFVFLKTPLARAGWCAIRHSVRVAQLCDVAPL